MRRSGSEVVDGRSARRHGALRVQAGAVLWGILAALVLAGCGSDDDVSRAATPTRTAVASATATAISTNTVVPPNTPTATPLPPTPTAPPASPTPTITSIPTATATAEPTATATSPVANPLVEGPVTGGRGVPFLQATTFDLALVGYAENEFFISGTATAYAATGELGIDGVWAGVPAGTTAAYKTRIVVYRPIDDGDFNGAVVVEWMNVSGGLDAAPDWTSTHTELIREGYAWVGVSAQRVGIEGGGPFDLSLKTIDRVRYASLVHPGDSFSYDMFSQAGRAVLDPDGLDPLEGLRPARLIAAGESQSAGRLVTYVNAIHPLVRLYDGFLIHSRGGGGAPLSQEPLANVPVPTGALIRTDLAEPVLTFQTETDLFTLGFLPARQPDTPLLRLWEVAGTAHADTYTLLVGFTDQGDTPAGGRLVVTAEPIPGFIVCDRPINSGPQHIVLKAAIDALDGWIRGEGPPPISPRLEVEGDPPQFVLDEVGNVRGGIRTPWVDAPLAVLSGLGQTGGTFCRLFGTTAPFDAGQLTALYGDSATYLAAVETLTDQGVAAGFIRPLDAVVIKQAAAEVEIGG